MPCHHVNFFAENLSHAINTSKFSWALLFSLSRKTCWCKWGLKSQYFRRLLFFHFSKGGFPLSRNFYVRTRVKFMCVNVRKAALKRKSWGRFNYCVSVCTTFHTFPWFYLRAWGRKNYAKVKIQLASSLSWCLCHFPFFSFNFEVWLNWKKSWKNEVRYEIGKLKETTWTRNLTVVRISSALYGTTTQEKPRLMMILWLQQGWDTSWTLSTVSAKHKP